MVKITNNLIKEHDYYNKNFFKRLAKIYDYAEFLISHIRKEVVAKVSDKNAKILDVACGTGNQSVAFAKKRFSVIGIDLSKDMLRLAKTKVKSEYNLNFIYRDAIKIPYKKSTFDVSTISFGLHDMPEEIAIKILKEMKRVTKDNGQTLIVDYHKPKNVIKRFVGKIICKIWESKYYDHYMKLGLENYLDKTKFKIVNKKLFLLDNIQLVECKKDLENEFNTKN